MSPLLQAGTWKLPILTRVGLSFPWNLGWLHSSGLRAGCKWDVGTNWTSASWTYVKYREIFVSSSSIFTVHYRLRVIRGDPSGVVNFASHPKQNSCFHFLSHSFVLMKPFWNFFEILDKSYPLSFPDFFCTNLGHCHAKNSSFGNMGFEISEKQALTFGLFYITKLPKGAP